MSVVISFVSPTTRLRVPKQVRFCVKLVAGERLRHILGIFRQASVRSYVALNVVDRSLDVWVCMRRVEQMGRMCEK
jgi:hypothetical protein